jgi:hypothetical protein
MWSMVLWFVKHSISLMVDDVYHVLLPPFYVCVYWLIYLSGWVLNRLAGTGSRRVPATRAGTDLGHNLYPVADMGFLAGVFYPDRHVYGQTIASERVPDAISIGTCM